MGEAVEGARFVEMELEVFGGIEEAGIVPWDAGDGLPPLPHRVEPRRDCSSYGGK